MNNTKSKFLRVVIFIFTLTQFSSCYFFKAMKYKKYPLEKLGEFPAVKFQRSEQPFKFYQGSLQKSVKAELDSMLLGSNRYAFLVIRNDSIIYEFYNHKITDTSLIHSFSVAKSYVSTMIAMAKEEGKIKSLNEPITNYLPELIDRDVRFKNITIQHVLDMRSGIKSSENYFNPLSDVLRLGFGKNVNGKALRISIEKEPNQKFEYKSINTQLLGMIVERATKIKLQDYYYEKLHKPLQLEHDATWIYDDEKHKTLRAFCCMNLTARDYAKFGRLFLNKGNWQGKQLVSKEWVENILNLDTIAAYEGYKNQWWKDEKVKFFKDSAAAYRYYLENVNSKATIGKSTVIDNKSYWMVSHYNDGVYARGLLQQHIYIIPKKNTIMVLLSNVLNEDKPLKKGFYSRMSELFK
jgi:CubicO group peptidase (beta-lactamase class C family)